MKLVALYLVSQDLLEDPDDQPYSVRDVRWHARSKH